MKTTAIVVNIIGWMMLIIGVILGYLDLIGIIDLDIFIWIQLFLLGLLDVMLFMWLLYFIRDDVIEKGYNVLKLYLIIVTPIFIGVKVYEWITGSTFIYSIQFRFVPLVFLIYPVYMLFYGFLRTRQNKVPGSMAHTVLVAGMLLVTLYVHGFFIAFSGSAITPLHLEDTDRELVLVENSFLFSSNHQVYEKDNDLFISSVRYTGGLTCHDGCITGHPEYFEWVWLDEDTLQVSGGGSFQTATYYFDESE